MKAHADRPPWHKQILFFDLNCLPRVRGELIRFAAGNCPPLKAEDAVGLFVFGLSMRIARFVSPKGVPFLRLTRIRCSSAALEIVANADVELLYRWGVTPVLAPAPSLVYSMSRWWTRWYSDVLMPSCSSNDEQSERDRRVHKIANAIMSEAIADNVIGDVWKGLLASRRERGLSEPAGGEDTRASAVAAFWALPPTDEKEDNCYYIGNDSKIHISSRYIRDKEGRGHRRRIDASRAEGLTHIPSHVFAREIPSTDLLEEENEALEAVGTAAMVSTIVDEVSSAEIAGALDEVVTVLRKSKRPGIIDQVLLDHVKDILDGKVTPTELARRRGLSKRSMRAGWHRIQAQIARHPKMRGWLKSA